MRLFFIILLSTQMAALCGQPKKPVAEKAIVAAEPLIEIPPVGANTGLNKTLVKEYYALQTNNGSFSERCMLAGFIASSFLNEETKAEFAHWKNIEKYDCADQEGK